MVRLLMIALGLGLLLYVGIKADTLSMTIDEASTFHSWQSKPVKEIVFNIPAHPNNHILNSLLMKLSVATLGISEWSVRLPNVLAYALYLFFSFRIGLLLNHFKWLPLLTFVALNFNPYKLDFFVFGRGYGLAMAFMLGSIYACFKWMDTGHKKQLFFSFFMAILAVYSNFVWLNYFVSLLFIVFVIVWLQNGSTISFGEKMKKVLPISALSCFLLGLLIFIPLKNLQASGTLQITDHWGSSGFWKDTYYTIFENVLYNQWYFSEYTVEIFLISVSLFYCFSILHTVGALLHKRKEPTIFYAVFIFSVPLLIGLSTVVQHYLFGTGYLINRTALIFSPLMGLALPVLLNGLPSTILVNKVHSQLIIIGFLALHALSSMRIDSTRMWSWGLQTREIIQFVDEKANPDVKIKLGTHWSFMPGINFYITNGQAPNVEWVKWDKELRSDDFYDYYLIYEKDSTLLHNSYVPIKSFGEQQILFKRSSK